MSLRLTHEELDCGIRVLHSARSHANQANLFIDRKGAHPLDIGHEQAACLAERLSSQGVSTFRTSPLRRSVQTAHILSSVAGAASPVIDEVLIE